jgi:hypothetical protein
MTILFITSASAMPRTSSTTRVTTTMMNVVTKHSQNSESVSATP